MRIGTFLLPVIGVCAFSQPLFAECHLKCVSRNPFNGRCITKINVCDIGSPADWVEQSKNEVNRTTKGLQDAWHDVYGVLPEETRNILNTHSFTILGASFGGLEGAALGTAVDELLLRTRLRLQRTKQHIENSPSWKAAIYHAGEQIAAMKDGDIVFSGQASKLDFTSKISPFYEDFLTCVDAAQDINQGWDCVDKLEDSANTLLREARRQ